MSEPIIDHLRNVINGAMASGQSSRAIAKASGVNDRAIARTADGRTCPRLLHAARVARSLGFKMVLVRADDGGPDEIVSIESPAAAQDQGNGGAAMAAVAP